MNIENGHRESLLRLERALARGADAAILEALFAALPAGAPLREAALLVRVFPEACASMGGYAARLRTAPDADHRALGRALAEVLSEGAPPRRRSVKGLGALIEAARLADTLFLHEPGRIATGPGWTLSFLGGDPPALEMAGSGPLPDWRVDGQGVSRRHPLVGRGPFDLEVGPRRYAVRYPSSHPSLQGV